MNKSFSSVNLNMELHVVSTFWLESDTSGTFSFYVTQPSLKRQETPALKMHSHFFGAKLTFAALAAGFLQNYLCFFTISFQFYPFVNRTISDTLGIFSLYFAKPSLKREKAALKMQILWCRTDICSCKLSSKVFLRLERKSISSSICL